MANGLGRGLDSLIPKKVNKGGVTSGGDAIVNVTSEDEKGRIIMVDPELIEVNPFQPRKRFTDTQLDELINSIKEYGIIQPLIVTHQEGKYELIAGERRLRSARKLKLEEVPIIIRDADKQEKLEVALIENIQRENLNPIETAASYRKLIDEFGLSQEDMAKRVGKSRSSVANTLRLLNLPEEIRLALMEGKITEGHGKILLGIENEVKMMSVFRKILHGGLSVKTTISETRKMTGAKEAQTKINYQDQDNEFKLREFFKTKVEIKRKKKGGQIVIDFSSDDELKQIINLLR